MLRQSVGVRTRDGRAEMRLTSLSLRVPEWGKQALRVIEKPPPSLRIRKTDVIYVLPGEGVWHASEGFAKRHAFEARPPSQYIDVVDIDDDGGGKDIYGT